MEKVRTYLDMRIPLTKSVKRDQNTTVSVPDGSDIGDVAVLIDFDRLRGKAAQALRSKQGKSVLAHGAIQFRVIKKRHEVL